MEGRFYWVDDGNCQLESDFLSIIYLVFI